MKAFQFLGVLLFALGLTSSHAESSSGFVIGWGSNVSGEATGVPSPETYYATGVVTMAGHVLSNVVAVSASDSHSLALCNDGTVVGFGGNFLGMAVGFTNAYPYRIIEQVRLDGRVLSNVVSIVASREFCLALKKNGTVVTWGENYIPDGLTNIAAIAAEWSCSWALRRDGTVAGWVNKSSWRDYGQLLQVGNLSNVVAIAVGPGGNSTRGVALRSDGTVVHWGGKRITRMPPRPLV